MAIRSIVFILFFTVTCGGALWTPILGIVGYVGHYSIGPERQWWFAPMRPLGIRCSLTLALMTAVGMFLHWRRLRFGRSFLTGQEKLILAFLGLVWISTLISVKTVGAYTIVDHPSEKLTKMVIFVLMMTHVVTDIKKINILTWTLIIGALALGLQALDTPQFVFTRGRLETVGGADFQDANTLAAYLAAMLPLIGIQFFKSGWKGKVFCAIITALVTNTIVLTRSRGALVGIGAGVLVAIILAPKKHRAKITVALTLAIIGGIYLTDPGFRRRASTINQSGDARDRSSQSRLEIWQGGKKMLVDNPQGVGAGNFQQTIGRYAPGHANRDAHSTYVRCAGELGLAGVGLLAVLLGNALAILKNTIKQAKRLPHPYQDNILYTSYGFLISFIIFAVCGALGTFLYNEAFWWLLALPVCLSRAVENLATDLMPLEKRESHSSHKRLESRESDGRAQLGGSKAVGS